MKDGRNAGGMQDGLLKSLSTTLTTHTRLIKGVEVHSLNSRAGLKKHYTWRTSGAFLYPLGRGKGRRCPRRWPPGSVLIENQGTG